MAESEDGEAEFVGGRVCAEQAGSRYGEREVSHHHQETRLKFALDRV